MLSAVECGALSSESDHVRRRHTANDASVLFDPAQSRSQRHAWCASTPFRFLIAHEQLPPEAARELERDFPKYCGCGLLPLRRKGLRPEHQPPDRRALTDPAVASCGRRQARHRQLGQYPTLVTLCRALNKRHGTIHTDSKSKVATALLYLNESWPDTSDGCFRFLNRVDDIDDLAAPEIRPLYGNFVVFKRADNSFHGHLPYEGERRVIQVAWLTSEDEKLRKTQRGKLSRLFKKLFGSLDNKLGAGRDKNAAHKD